MCLVLFRQAESARTKVVALMMTVQAVDQDSQVSRHMHLTSDPSLTQIKQHRDTSLWGPPPHQEQGIAGWGP